MLIWRCKKCGWIGRDSDLGLHYGNDEEYCPRCKEVDSIARVGFPAYALQNNNANIHRVEERVKSLKAVKEKGTKETEGIRRSDIHSCNNCSGAKVRCTDPPLSKPCRLALF